MKNFNCIFLSLFSLALFSCTKEKNTTPQKWQFTNIVNMALSNSGDMLSLDFYQKRGDEWRIVRMEPDDHTKFFFDTIITPSSYELPIKNGHAFMTCNAKLFDPSTNKIHDNYKMKWLTGSPVLFNTLKDFNPEFPDIPTAFNNINKFTAATYSLEKAYDNNAATQTYIFYDFPNHKYLYYGFRNGADLLLQNDLNSICPTCNTVDWQNIDAATCTNGSPSSIYYFFDFDAQKMRIIFRNDKNTNHPNFDLDSYTYDFKEAFFEKGTSSTDGKYFDFSK